MILLADLSDISPAAPGTVASKMVSPTALADVIGNLSEYKDVTVVSKLQGATGGTLDVYLQSWDGTDWVDWLHYTQLAALTPAASLVYVPDYPIAHALVTVGRNLTPALAVNSSVGGHPGEALRMLFVAGAGTSAGALQTMRILARNRWTR